MFGNFFYRLQQKGLSNNTLIKLVGHVLENISNDGASWDREDFKRAVDSFSEDSTIQSAIDEVFVDMEYIIVSTPPPVGGGSGTPPAPFISGTFSYCLPGVTHHTISWAAPSGASSYKVYAIQPTGLLGLEGSITSTSTLVYANYDTIWYVRACNSSGCSDYSNGFPQLHSCE